MSHSEKIKIQFTPEFKHNLRRLAKKYRHIRSDIQSIIDQLQNGKVIGNQVPGVKHQVFKVRAINRDIQKGKRSGYRLIYYRRAKSSVILVTVYSKIDQSDISPKEIRSIILELEEGKSEK